MHHFITLARGIKLFSYSTISGKVSIKNSKYKKKV
jgi:hypothetical protein